MFTLQTLGSIRKAGPFAWADHVFLAAVVVQGLHIVEHIAQVAQKFFLELPRPSGILGAAFDTEWVHFTYNLTLLAVLLVLVLAYGLHRSEGWEGHQRWYPAALVFAATVQLAHMGEHAVKLTQHLSGACEACPGLLGSVVDLVWLHFSINLLVMVPMTLALVGFVLESNAARLPMERDLHSLRR